MEHPVVHSALYTGRNMKAILTGFIVMLTVGVALVSAHDGKILWCHYEPNGNSQTLNLPQQALENAGHIGADGNPLHAGDHPGQCVTPSVSLSPSPLASPSVGPSTAPSVSPAGSPSPTPTPTPSPSVVNFSDTHPKLGAPSLSGK